MQIHDEEYVTVAEAADILSVAQRTVFGYIKAGKFSDRKDGHRRLLLLSEVMALRHDPTSYDPEKHIIVDKPTWERVLAAVASSSEYAAQMGFKIGQLETENRGLEDKVKLLEDRRPWWRRWRA